MKIYFEKLKQLQGQIEHVHEEIDGLKNQLYDIGKDVERITAAMEKDMAKMKTQPQKDEAGDFDIDDALAVAAVLNDQEEAAAEKQQPRGYPPGHPFHNKYWDEKEGKWVEGKPHPGTGCEMELDIF